MYGDSLDSKGETILTTIQAILLGIVQGIAEFLPISSSGHLVLLQRIFGIEYPALTFDIVVHLGTLCSILAVFWKDVWALVKNPFSKMTGLLIVASLPVVVAGLFLRDAVEGFLRGGLWLAVAFTITGVLLQISDRFTSGEKSDKDITYLDALIVGCMQAMALPPGISRSGTTITGALMRGINREAATRFSFMLAIIAIAGSGALEAFRIATGEASLGAIGVMPMAAGFITSALVGFLSIGLLLKLIKACKLRYFSFYVWALALFILIDYVVTR